MSTTNSRYRNAHITSSGLIPAATDFSGPGEVIVNIPDGKQFTLDYLNNVVQLSGGGGGIASASGSAASASLAVTASYAKKAARSEVEFHAADYYDSSISTDWGIAINAAIADCLGASDPVTTVRTAKGPIILPPGNLQVRTQISVKSAIGFSMRGSSRYSTALCPDAVVSGLDLVGVVYSNFRDFSIRGAGTVTNGIYSYHDATQAIKYPTTNGFFNVDIMELTFVNGFHIGGTNNGDQTDKHGFYDCKVQGSWTWANGAGATYWQNGHLFGISGGGAGNNLVHNIYHLNSANLINAVNNGGTCINVYGGSTEQTHIVINESGGPIETSLYSGIRAEGSRYLYVSYPGATWDRKATIQNCTFHEGNMEGPTWMQLGGGGTYIIDNVMCEGDDPGSYTPIISMGSSNATTVVMVRGLSICNGDVSSVEKWIQYEPNTTVIAQAVAQISNQDSILVMQTEQKRLANVSTVSGSRGSAALGSLLNIFKLRGDIKDVSYSSLPVSDSYNRVDSTNSPGAFTVINNVMGVTGSQGYFVNNTGSRAIALLGSMSNGIIDTSMYSADWNAQRWGIVFRYTDPNNYLVIHSGAPQIVYFGAMISGALTEFQTASISGFGNSSYTRWNINVSDNIVDVVSNNIPQVRWTMNVTQSAMLGTGSGITLSPANRPTGTFINYYNIIPQ